jgi:hypothetical protein
MPGAVARLPGFRAARNAAGVLSTASLTVLVVLAAAPLSFAQARPDSVRIVDLGISTRCPACTVQITRELTITGEDTEEYGGVTRAWLKRDSRGLHYTMTSFAPGVLIYDERGRFVRVMGRLGEGPGEFRGVNTLHVGSGDTLHLFDFALRRYQVFSPSHEFVRGHRVDVIPRNVLELRPGHLVVDFNRGERSAFGLPLHVIQDSAVVFSFGGRDALVATGRPEGAALARALTRASDSTFWAARWGEYLLEEWDLTGRLLTRMSRRVDWMERAPLGSPGAAVNPSCSHLTRDETGLLWLLCWVRRPDWEELSYEAPSGLAGQTTRVSRTGSRYDLFESILEVIDPERGEIVASARLPQYILGFLGDGRAYTYEQDELGVGRFAIWRLDIAEGTPSAASGARGPTGITGLAAALIFVVGAGGWALWRSGR